MSIVSTRYGDMRIIDNDKVISHSLLIYGEWAMDEINLLKQIITPGAYVLDVGAFIGTHTLAFSNMVGEQGKVYSFEPRREIYTILSENISTNCKNVIAQNIGLAEELKTLHLDRIDTKSNENFGGLSLSEDLESSSNTYQVEISTIDALDFKKIDLIKIDVEGMERKVLDGAVKSIRRHKPVIYCECNSLNAGNEIIEFCSEQKYKVWGFLASAYNPNNFNEVADNLFGEAKELALLLIPKERDEMPLDKSSIDKLLPVITLEDLVLPLLHKPQYAHEILATTFTSKLGINFPSPIVVKLNKQIEDINQVVSERDKQIEDINQVVSERDKQIEDINQVVSERDKQIEDINQVVSERENTIKVLHSSSSWMITKPLRWTGRVLRGDFHGALDPFKRKYESCSNLQSKTKKTVAKFSSIKEAPIKSTHPVAVILPVYRDVETTKRCILAAMPGVLNIKDAKLVAINDASPDAGMQAMLEGFVSTWPEVFSVLENKNNLGFIQTVNRGLDYFLQYDVVLLNSDVIVPVDWLSRLINEAYLKNNIGTVTPFSNNATICSFPYFLQENSQPLSLDVDSIDAIFKKTRLTCVTAPTGVGFCMYIRRACLDEVGYLNYEKFGRGYGEENDLCQRALKQNWLNVLSPNIYAYHEGGVSFSSDKQALINRAMGVIDELHPNYHADIQQFVKEDPLKSVRVTRHLQLLSETAIPKVLHISHALGGGVAQHIEELAEFFDQDVVHLMLTPYEGNGAVSISLGVEAHADTLVFSMPSDYDDMLQLLQTIGVSSVHFHHTINLSSKILELPHDLDVPHILTVHDFYWLNGNPTLTDESGKYPGHYDYELKNPLHSLPEGLTLEEFRAQLKRLIKNADKIIFPSNATKSIFENVYVMENAIVAPHVELNRDVNKAPIPFVKKDKYIIGVLGALGKEKGADLLEEMAVIAAKANMPFKFKLLGYAYRPLKSVETTGPYSQADLTKMLQQHEVDIIFFPAQWPETYSYTLSYALESGVPIVATDLGAFPERLSGRKNSLLFDQHTSIKALIEQLTLFVDAIAAGREVNAPEFNGGEFKSNFYESMYLVVVSSGLKQTDLIEQSKSILLKSAWCINQSATDAGWREAVLATLWRLYMHHSTNWLGRLIPSSTRRFIRKSLSR